MNTNFRYYTLLLWMLLSSAALHAQAWHPFPGGNTFAFTYNIPASSGTNVLAVKFDSARVEGADSAFYFYRCLRELATSGPYNGCNNQQVYFNLENDEDHFLGEKLLRDSSGDCRFVFSAGDTFLLKSKAGVGASWIWGGAVTASVDSVVAGNVLGVLDSLKYVSLSDGKQIILSKSLGCVKLPFPQALSGGLKFINSSLFLDGIHELGLGFRIPMGLEWLMIEPETHAVKHSYHFSFGLGGASNTSDVEFWVDSLLNFGNYLIVYKHQQAVVSSWSYNGGSSTNTIPYQAVVDTLREEWNPQFFRLPFQSLPDLGDPIPYPYQEVSQVPTAYYKWSEDSTRLVMVTGNYVLMGDTCASGLVHYWGTWENLSGFGMLNSETDDPHGWSESYMETQCIETPSLQYGTCPVVVANQPEVGGTESLSVFPMPTSGIIHVMGLDSRQSGQLEVVSVEGKSVFWKQFSSATSDLELDLSEFGAGIYFLRIQQGGIEPIVRKVIVVD